MIVVDRLTLTGNMTYVNFISPTELSIRGILYVVLNRFKSRLNKSN